MSGFSVVAPTPGRDVYYKSRTGNYILPAKVVVTFDNIFEEGVDKGDIADLDSPVHVHLKVFSPGEDYVESNVPHATSHEDFDGERNPFPAGSWKWPDLVPDRIWENGHLDGSLLPMSASHPDWEEDRRI